MKKVTLGDVAFEAKNTFSGDRTNVPVVGLEHLDPGEVKLSRWNSDSENTFTKSFRKGEVLFGRRRAYLKKAAVAPCDGICSGDITVIAAKEGKIQPELLPFIIQSERFFDFAVKGSAGSLSPRVKWEHLKHYEFELPPIEGQRKLADLLWAAYELKESYKKLLAATDEMGKSRFVEMFGSPEFNTKNFAEKSLGNLFRIGSSKRILQSEQVLHGVPFLRISDLMQRIEGKPNNATQFVSEAMFSLLQKDGLVPKTGDILITSRGTIGSCYVIQPDDCFYFQDGMISWLSERDSAITNTYLVYLFQMPGFRKQMDKMLAGSTVAYLSIAMLKKISVRCPPLVLQNEFAAFIEQLDKSKLELKGAIAKLEQVKKSLLP